MMSTQHKNLSHSKSKSLNQMKTKFQQLESHNFFYSGTAKLNSHHHDRKDKSIRKQKYTGINIFLPHGYLDISKMRVICSNPSIEYGHFHFCTSVSFGPKHICPKQRRYLRFLQEGNQPAYVRASQRK